MTYKKTAGGFEKLPSPNVDFGGGLERIAAASNNNPDVFRVSLLEPIITGLESLSGKKYEEYQTSMRVIADHLRAAVFLAVDGVAPSNKAQGYVLRRLVRRAVRYAFDLGIEQDLCARVVPIVNQIYQADFPEVAQHSSTVTESLDKEEKIFRQTLRSGVREYEKIMSSRKKAWHKIGEDDKIYEKVEASTTPLLEAESPKIWNQYIGPVLFGEDIFKLYDTHGFPIELSLDEAARRGDKVSQDWNKQFKLLMAKQRANSQTASKGMFRGGLADHSEEVIKLHTATHLMYRALKNVLGDQVVQRGSNITAERTRFDFSHPEKLTPEQLKQVEDTVNQKITEDLPVTWQEEDTNEAFVRGASGAFGDKYGDRVKVYTIGDPENPFSREICGGPHVEHTGQIGAGGKRFKITKEESSSAGVRRIKAELQ
jgi:alanyl-tRNA synthetase